MTWGIFKEDSVSETYKKMKAEELKGNQHKLDKNKNGKLDAEDFKKLRGEETQGAVTKEEVEEIDEISLDTMKSAKEKLKDKAWDAHQDDNKYGAQHYAGRAVNMASKIKQKEKMTKEEVELDEKIIVDKDGKQIGGMNMAHRLMNLPTKVKPSGNSTSDSYKRPFTVPSQRKPSNVPAGAVAKSVTKEEVESFTSQLDELSIDKLKSYINKAKPDLKIARQDTRSAGESGDDENFEKAFDRQMKRRSGIKTAKAKLNKEEVVDEAMSKADTPTYLRKKMGDKPLTMADVKAAPKDSISHPDNLAKARGVKEEVEEYISIDEEIAELELALLRESDNEDHVTSKVHKIEVSPDGFSRGEYAHYVKNNHGVKTNFHGKPIYHKKSDSEFHHVSYTGSKKNVTAALKAHREDNRDNAEYLRQQRDESLDIFSAREIDSLINEVLKASDGAGKWISDFVQSDDPRFTGDSKEQRKKRALAAYYAAHKKESVDYDSFLEEAAQGEIVKSGSKEIKHANVKDKEDDQEIMEPHSKGEQDFLDKHSVAVTDDPAAEYKSGSNKLAVAAKPTATGAGVYKADTKLSDKDKASVKESTGKKNCTEEDDSSCETGKKASGKSTYNTFKEKMNDKKGC